jgi:hypothetical protein
MDRLKQLIQVGLDSGEGVEVTDEWWEQWDRDLDNLGDFMSGMIASLPDTARFTALLNEVGMLKESGKLTSEEWKLVRERFRTMERPGF